MKKSELRAMVREMLQEELTKMNKLQESTAVLDRPGVAGASVVRAGNAQRVAFDLINSPEFQDALAADGNVLGDECDAVIEAAVSEYWPSASDREIQETIVKVRSIVREVIGDEGIPSHANTMRDPDVQRIYNATHDREGNEY